MLLWNFCFKNNEMQVCLTKIFLVEHQIFAQYATKSWNINPMSERSCINPWALANLYIFKKLQKICLSKIKYQIKSIGYQMKKVRKKRGTGKGKNLAIHIITLHHTQRITVQRIPNHHKKPILFQCVFSFNSYFMKYDYFTSNL